MKTDSFCAEEHKVEFQRGSANVAAVFDLALHVREPEGDVQGSNEVKNAGYARVQVRRDDKAWEVDGRVVRNLEVIVFPTIKSGQAMATHLSIGIEGKIRRTVKLKEAVRLVANRRIEFDPGSIEIIEKE